MFRLESDNLFCNSGLGVIILIALATVLLIGLGWLFFIEWKMSVSECKGYVYMAVLYVVAVVEAVIGNQCQ